ncbi:sulfatase-like hydrolase/transferase [Algoriphagus sp. CAU 1675]|uniref:LTA synthase family protein n=1 Tax=Algoriphagus sp. CAU 1675 TaxID=3032597 RepID=UPI0023DBDAF9|nr:sulfatase-like hydrolase/transferase [Algoriphagus sp. CAU 1675]MDF2157812.1 sulfatase-like hydrolase/transferase [Algoriphagus sp. CAU 1675]
MSLIFIGIMGLLRVSEMTLIFTNHILNFSIKDTLTYSLFQDISWNLYLLGLLFIVFLFLSIFSVKLARYAIQLFFTLAILIHIALIFYFFKTLIPLGKDLFGYSTDDLLMTVKASGQLNLISLTGGALLASFIFILLNLGIRLLSFSLKAYLYLTGVLILSIVGSSFFPIGQNLTANEVQRNIELNKSRFLMEQAFDYWIYGSEYYFDFYLRSGNDDLIVQKEFTNDLYPFAHRAEYPDVLSPYFDSLQQKPDIVFILVESLGKAYSGKDAYLGSFTPFLDSLEQHSLVWTNAISSTGRTFGLHPGIMGGLPFGEKGFLELFEDFPNHQTLLSVLRENDYETRYFIGADKNFDNVGSFIEYQQPVQLVDEKGFDPKFPRTPSIGNFSWGYADKELFNNALEKLPNNVSKPQIRIFQTQTSHDPYLVPEKPYYEAKLQSHLKDYLDISQDKIQDYLAYSDIYMTILYADDAIRDFFREYQKRPEFANTIFIITGDHRLPEIPMASSLDRFHVPLIIYSPLINRPDYFKGLSSHFELTPSLLAFLEKQVEIKLPEEVIWQGQVLDTAKVFQSRIAMPLMRNKNQLLDYLNGEYLLSAGQLYKISDNLNIDPIADKDMFTKLSGEFEDFKNKNQYMIQTRKLLPPLEDK